MGVLFSLKIESGNEAFSDNPREEIRRILHEFLESLDGFEGHRKLRDINGNNVGHVYLEIEEEEDGY